jgi:hypothetical protein
VATGAESKWNERGAVRGTKPVKNVQFKAWLLLLYNAQFKAMFNAQFKART